MGWVQDIDTQDDLRKARSARAPSTVTAPSPGTNWSTITEQGAKPRMQTWIDVVRAQLNLPTDVNIDVILDVARVAAQHREARPSVTRSCRTPPWRAG